jgi:hypothetical protein
VISPLDLKKYFQDTAQTIDTTIEFIYENLKADVINEIPKYLSAIRSNPSNNFSTQSNCIHLIHNGKDVYSSDITVFFKTCFDLYELKDLSGFEDFKKNFFNLSKILDAFYELDSIRLVRNGFNLKIIELQPVTDPRTNKKCDFLVQHNQARFYFECKNVAQFDNEYRRNLEKIYKKVKVLDTHPISFFYRYRVEITKHEKGIPSEREYLAINHFVSNFHIHLCTRLETNHFRLYILEKSDETRLNKQAPPEYALKVSDVQRIIKIDDPREMDLIISCECDVNLLRQRYGKLLNEAQKQLPRDSKYNIIFLNTGNFEVVQTALNRRINNTEFSHILCVITKDSADKPLFWFRRDHPDYELLKELFHLNEINT